MSHLHARRLFDGELAAVLDVRCRMPASPCGSEERVDEHQLVFTRVGAFVKHAGPRWRHEVVAEPLHVLVLDPDEPYRVSHPAGGGDECTVLAFAPHAAIDVAAGIDPRAVDVRTFPARISHALASAEVLLRLRTLRRRVLGPRVDAAGRTPEVLEVEDEALAILSTVLRAGYAAHGLRIGRRPGTARDRRELAERTREALAVRPGEPLTLSVLARRVNSSPYHLTRTFREVVGMPVHRYRLRLRLALALEHLEEGERNISDLALSLGFSSHSHFTTAFRRAFGVAPGALKRRGSRGEEPAAGRG
jgi:AraC-like DNA-binding protein